MIISLIAAMAKNRVIGKDNDLPWHLPDDMKFFQSKTKGHVVVMGRKNFDSLPEKFKPLPNRTNVILTRQQGFEVADCYTFHSLDDAIQFGRDNGEEELFVIGGGEIYNLALEIADRVYLTEISENYEGDTFFPELPTSWEETSRTHHPADDRHKSSFDFVVYEKG